MLNYTLPGCFQVSVQLLDEGEVPGSPFQDDIGDEDLGHGWGWAIF